MTTPSASAFMDDFARLAAECLSDPKTHDDRFRALAHQLEDSALAAELAERCFAVQQEVMPDLIKSLCAKDGLELVCEQRPAPKVPARILSKVRKEDSLHEKGKSQFLKVLADLAAARFLSEDLAVLRRAYDAALAFFEAQGAPLFKSDRTPNELSLRFVVEVRGAAIEVQFLHPAAKLMFSQNSIAAGHNTNLAAGETPNFFFMPGEPKPFYDALSDAVIGHSVDATLPALLARTYTSKGWTEDAIPPELAQYAERYARTHPDSEPVPPPNEKEEGGHWWLCC